VPRCPIAGDASEYLCVDLRAKSSVYSPNLSLVQSLRNELLQKFTTPADSETRVFSDEDIAKGYLLIYYLFFNCSSI
jgi:hypothetical protein